MNDLIVKKNSAYVKKGIFWGLLSGILCGFLTIFEDRGLALEPFSGLDSLALFAVPVIFGCLQDAASCLCVFGFNLANGKAAEYVRAVKTKPFLLLTISAIIGGPGAACFYLAGVYFAGPFYPVVLSATFPAMGAVLSRIVLKEKISKRGWLGIAVAVIGAMVVSMGSGSMDISAYPHFTLGCIFGLLAAVGWAVEGVVSNAGMDFIDPEVANGLRYTISLIFYLLIGIPFISGVGLKGYSILASALHGKVLFYVFMAGAVEGIGYYYYYKANNACGVARAQTFNSTYTAWSCIICAVVYHEALALNFWVGLLLVIGGGVLIAGKPSELFSLRDI